MRRTWWLLICGLIALSATAGGCRKPVFFPAEAVPLPSVAEGAGGYDTDGDGRCDFFTFRSAGADGKEGRGRITRIGYDRSGDGRPDRVVDLDALALDHCRHLVIILDGVGYDLLKAYYDGGGLALFHPPSRLIAPYPSLTDLCFEDFFAYVPCKAFEAEYYDHQAGRIVGGSAAYLRGENTPYNRLLHYRADLIMDAIGYVFPWEVFGKEINDSKRLFDKGLTREVRVYYVSSAGVGTRMGAEGHRNCLRKVEQLVNQAVWETNGLTKVTLLADHGHTYTPAKRAPIEPHLKGRGWRLVKRLKGPRDVAHIRFGLETCASFATKDPAALAADLIECEGVELASYAITEELVAGDGSDAPAAGRVGAVMLLGRDGGKARIIGAGGGKLFRYDAISGDPLRLKPILAALAKAGKDRAGYYAADDLLAATATHEYPAPLQRLWRAHFGLVEDPADVIVSLADDYYSGSRGFAAFTKVASTHGGLNRRNSTTFIMSTIGPLPPVMRSSDIPEQMKRLTGRDWPGAR